MIPGPLPLPDGEAQDHGKEAILDAYIALIRKAADTDYSVNFPDLPGCTTAGATIDEAYANAREALELHIEGMREDKEPVPVPRDLETVMADPEHNDAVAILVEAPPVKSRSVPVTITIDERLLAQIDAAAEIAGTSRSAFLADAARAAMHGVSLASASRAGMTGPVVLIGGGAMFPQDYPAVPAPAGTFYPAPAPARPSRPGSGKSKPRA